MIEEIKSSLKKNEAECQYYLTRFLKDYIITSQENTCEVICEFEDMDNFFLSPIYRYIYPDQNIATGVPKIGDDGERFFTQASFMPDKINESNDELWVTIDSADKYYQLIQESEELAKQWILTNWEFSCHGLSIDIPLFYCKHHWNYKTINLKTGEERILF